MKTAKAKYHDAVLPEHKGNPFIEALPEKLGTKDLLKLFSNYPTWKECHRLLPAIVRTEYTTRIKALRQPLSIYFECFLAIESAIKQGYSSKNPFSATTAQFLHYPVDAKPDIEPYSGYFQPKGDSLTLIGESGVGKTSMLEQLLHCFPQVIEHKCYKRKVMQFSLQVVWIKVDCPHRSSVRDLCEEILSELDAVLGHKPSNPQKTIGKLTRQIEQKIKSCFLGILVIDEMQRLTFKRTGGEHNLLSFLHSLVNKLGVPIFFCGNPPFDVTLSKQFKAARRAESGGCFFMKPLERDDPLWTNFIRELWDMQWTNLETKLTEELSNKMFDLCLGNLDLAHRIYKKAQCLVIGTDNEVITIGVLDDAFSQACGLTANNPEFMHWKLELSLMPRRPKVLSDEKIIKPVIRDINRAQHPEFEDKLNALKYAENLTKIKNKPHMFQESKHEDDPDDYLRKEGMLCEYPLLQFG